MNTSWNVSSAPRVDDSTRVRLLHHDYVYGKRRRSKLTLVRLILNLVAIVCSFVFLLVSVRLVFDWRNSERLILTAIILALFALLTIGAERRLRRESDSLSANLLKAERRLWKAGVSDFVSEHVARHQQPITSNSSTVLLREPKSPSGADLVATERLMQSYLDLVVAPFGSVAQVRANPDSLDEARSRVARTLGAADSGSTGTSPIVGVVCPSSFDPLNSEANRVMLTQARLWQEADKGRVLVCGSSFRPLDFDPWDLDSMNRLNIFLPQLGREAAPRGVAMQTALLLSEREDFAGVSLFAHRGDLSNLEQAFLRRGLLSQTAFCFDVPSTSWGAPITKESKKVFYQLNAPRLERPLTFDVGAAVDTNVSEIMANFFKVGASSVMAALDRVDEIQHVERYVYLPEGHRVEIAVTSWRSSSDNRQDLLWELLRAFASFYRSDGDWRRGGSPALTLKVDQVTSQRSGEFMEHLAVARQTRELIGS